ARFGTFITNGSATPSRVTLKISAMPPRCRHATRRKPSITEPGLSDGATISAPQRQAVGKPSRQAFGPNLGRRGIDVVGHASKNQFAPLRVQDRVGSRRVAVARLP